MQIKRNDIEMVFDSTKVEKGRSAGTEYMAPAWVSMDYQHSDGSPSLDEEGMLEIVRFLGIPMAHRYISLGFGQDCLDQWKASVTATYIPQPLNPDYTAAETEEECRARRAKSMELAEEHFGKAIETMTVRAGASLETRMSEAIRELKKLQKDNATPEAVKAQKVIVASLVAEYQASLT